MSELKTSFIMILLTILLISGTGVVIAEKNTTDSNVNSSAAETNLSNNTIIDSLSRSDTASSESSTGYSRASTPGAPPGIEINSGSSVSARSTFVQSKSQQKTYNSQTFTVSDIVTFSYRDGNQVLTPSGSHDLDRGEAKVDNVNRGVYDISAEGPFSTLWGDPVSRTVVGYFASTGDGSALSKNIHTYIPSHFDNRERVIVFGYRNNTDVTVNKAKTGEELFNGTLDDGEFKTFKNEGIPHSSFITIDSNKSVSVQTYFDQGFYVPAKNGKWSGKEFYTHVGYVGDWTNDMVISAFEDNTNITINNMKTNEIIYSGTVDAMEYHNEPFEKSTYVRIETNKTTTVGVRPYNSWSDDSIYNQGANVPSQSGSKIGTDFTVPTLDADYVYVSAYENNTEISLINTETDKITNKKTLDAGQTVNLDPNAGFWRILTDKRVSVQTGYGQATASFAPVEFGETETAILEGVITDQDGAPLENATVNIYDANNRYNVGDLLSPETTVETNPEGKYKTNDINAGKYFLVVDAENYDPVVSQSVQVPRTTEPVSLDVRLTGMFNPVTNKIEDIDEASKTVIEENTESAAEVYIDGYNKFENPSFSERLAPDDLQDGIGVTLTAIDTSLSLANPQGTAVKVVAEETGKYVIEETAWSLADHGVDESVSQQFATLPEERQKRIKTSAKSIQEEPWLQNYQYTQNESTAITEGYTQSDIYTTTYNKLAESGAEYEDITDSVDSSTVDDDFSVEATANVLEQQEEWLRGNGPADGMVITPTGNVYMTKQTQAHQADFERAKTQAEVAGAGSTVMDGVSTAGSAAVVYGNPSTKAVGAVAQGVGTVGGWAFQTYKLQAENRMGKQWSNTQIYWAYDAKKVAKVKNESVNWVEKEINNPEVQDASVDVSAKINADISTDGTPIITANRPKYPWYITSPLPQWKAVKNTSVTIENTGKINKQDTRIIVTDGYTSDNNNRISEGVSVYPGPNKKPLELTNKHSAKIPFSSDFNPLKPFEPHYLTVDTWTEGKLDDSNSIMYFIAPSANTPFVGFSAQNQHEIESNSLVRGTKYAYTTAESDSNISITQQTFNDQYGSVSKVMDSKVSPETTELNTTYDTDDISKEVSFLMISESGSSVNLHAYDDINRHVGFSKSSGKVETQIPNSSYTGTADRYERITVKNPNSGQLEITARASQFSTNDNQSVEIYAITTPDRPPILGSTPADERVTTNPGESENITFELKEVGGEQSVNNINVTAGQFETGGGVKLPSSANVTVAQSPDSISASEESEIVVQIEIPETIEIPESNRTRFTGEINIDTENADELNLSVSVLILNTDSKSVELTRADKNIKGVTTKTKTADNLSIKEGHLPTPVSTPSESYAAEIIGDGNLSFQYTNRSMPEIEIAYAIHHNGSWSELETTQSKNSIYASVISNSGTNVNIQNVSAIVITKQYTNNNGTVTTDPLKLAIEDWRDKNIDEKKLIEITNAWKEGEQYD